MKSRLHRIEIENFKAFRTFTLELEGRHLLVYGPNGSGKSSLYWALYTFLQSARKPQDAIAKYFEPSGPENLLNIHEDVMAKPGEVALTLRDATTKADTTYRISRVHHETHRQPAILKGDLASDFITYRFFFGFSHFRNSERFNLWPLFENEILPFCVSTATGTLTPLDDWNAIKSGDGNPSRTRGRGGTNSYNEFKRKTDGFAAILPGIVGSISDRAQQFYDEHFSADDPIHSQLKLGVTTLPAYDIRTRRFTPPEIGFAIQVGSSIISRPQIFLNEAKLTQLALSVRFAASLVNLHESDLKLLVLDDLLVSLDMSNRMKIVEILLSDTFADYQKIILTHELGFFREFRRKVGASHPDWYFVRLEGVPSSTITCHGEKTDIQKAEDYLHGHDLDEAALCLRKAAEDMGKRWREWLEKRQLPPGRFFSLTENLRAAKKRLLAELPMQFLQEVLERTPVAARHLLIASSDDDIDNNPDLDAAAKGILKSKRNRLRRILTDDHVERLRKIALVDGILACTERVLNPAAHAGSPPLYEKEIQDALDLIKQLEPPLST